MSKHGTPCVQMEKTSSKYLHHTRGSCCGSIRTISRTFPMNTLAYNTAIQGVRMAVPCCCKQYTPLNVNAFQLRIRYTLYQLQYVGETGQPLHHRTNGHRFDVIYHQTDVSPVAAHVTIEGHSETQWSVIIIDVCWNEDTILRKIQESRWIRMFGTSGPSGLNLRTDGL